MLIPHLIQSQSLLRILLDALAGAGALHPAFVSTCTDGAHHAGDCVMHIVTKHWSIVIRPR